MKKVVIVLLLMVVMLFTGCIAKPYSFKESVNEIISIEIVSAKSSLDYTVVKTLSDDEKEIFLEQFLTIEFKKYLGDPSGIYGDAIKITYQSGAYEMICPFATEYVKDDRIRYILKSCDEEAFNDLIKSFLDEDTSQTVISCHFVN